MSKNIIIQKAGMPQALTVDALRLKTQDGGSEDWLPADGKNLVELQIGGSGTYKASDYNAYGISVARVKPKYGGGATSKAAEHDFTEKHTSAIKEGGKSRNFSAKMLKTNLQVGGTCLWIPKMDVVLKNKYISKSGVYTAKADDCFGFDQVTVSGVDVEIIQDDDGDDVERTTDGGEVTETKLPSFIRVTVLPIKIDYNMGEAIDYTGLIVHAYTKSGIDLGTVPFNELILPAKKAGDGESDLYTDGDGINAKMLYYRPAHFHYGSQPDVDYTVYVHTPAMGEYTHAYGTVPATLGSSFAPGRVMVTMFDGELYAAGIGAQVNLGIFGYLQGISEWGEVYGWFQVVATSAYAQKDAFGGYGKYDLFKDAIPVSTKYPYGINPSTLHSTGEAIPVQWHRPGDGQLLETSFNIYIQST